MEENLNTALVSIIVITYNSAQYVLETLDSAKSQTYQNIELIVTDDCSSDDTVALCEQWIKENQERFVKTSVITTPKNTGIPANCNRGVRNAIGEWIKIIAGDDLLLERCIEINLNYCNTKNVNLLMTENYEFYDSFKLGDNNLKCTIPLEFIKLKDVESQFLFFLKGGYLSGSAFFINIIFLKKVGLFDEDYKLVEDRPLLLKMTSERYYISILNQATVAHRRHEAALTAIRKDKLIPGYLIQVYYAIKYYAGISNKKLYKVNAIWHILFIKMILKIKSKKTQLFFNYFRLKFQPIRLLWFNRTLSKLLD